jgi:uncharacterized membrane protein (UPF0127 family)
MAFRLSYFAIAAIAALAGCKPGGDAASDSVTVNEWLPLQIEGVEIQAQVALTPAEQSRGLMFRQSLPEDSGMLFPYPQSKRMSFWMKNTPLPLDIAFFDENGVLLEIRRMVPYDMTTISSYSADAKFALEMSSGWFAGKGLYPGSRLDLESVARALRSRGADPRLYRVEAAD